MPLRNMPLGTIVHNVEMKPGKAARSGASAGTYVQLVGREQGYALLRMTSGEKCAWCAPNAAPRSAAVSNPDHQNIVIGKAVPQSLARPAPWVRGVAMTRSTIRMAAAKASPRAAPTSRMRPAPSGLLRRRMRMSIGSARTPPRPRPPAEPAIAAGPWPITMFWWSGSDTAPIVARHSRDHAHLARGHAQQACLFAADQLH